MLRGKSVKTQPSLGMRRFLIRKSTQGHNKEDKAAKRKRLIQATKMERFPNQSFLETGGCITRSSSGLSKTDEGLHELCESPRVGCQYPSEIRRVLDRVSQLHVRGRLRHIRRKQNPRGRVRQPPRMFPQDHDDKIQKRLAWLDKHGPGINKTPNSFCFDRPDCEQVDATTPERVSAGHPAGVFCITSSRRGAGNSISGCGAAVKGGEILCHQPASHGATGRPAKRDSATSPFC